MSWAAWSAYRWWRCPTSVGYGASFGGLAALLAMLNSCAPGVSVVNIDNGYGAGVFAARVARNAHSGRSTVTTDHGRPARIAWLDASSGASGDMLLGALLGAGVPLGVIAEAVDKVAPGEVRLDVEEVRRGGFAATRCHVEVADTATQRTWRDVEQLLAGAGLHEDVRSLAHDVFSRLAEAEGRVHGHPAEDVHFHEVGALDAIADVVGACAGVVHLALDQVVVSEVSVGGGTVSSEHGRLPVPPPAVVELLRGVPSSGGPVDLELCTPTGAALLTTLADDWGSQPAMSVGSVGVGAGGRDPEGHANVLRLLIGVSTSSTGDRSASDPGSPLLLESNVDDLDPRLWPVVLGTLARGRGERCVADPDPDEEGPAGAHAERAGRGRPGRRRTP